MFDRSPGAPAPTPDTPPVAFERGSGRHRADTVQMEAVRAARPEPEPSSTGTEMEEDTDRADPDTGPRD